jgi:hypothetical protein
MQMKKTTKFFVFTLFLQAAFVLISNQQVFAYPAPKFDPTTKVCSLHARGGSILTLFYADIAGPSPEDIESFSVTGPSGTFYLNPGKSSKANGLYYIWVEPSIVANGNYTFKVTDKQGRAATLLRNFVYDSTLPQVSSATMSPANQSYVGTTTPTLSFDPVPGATYYQVVINDYDGNAPWYGSLITTATSFAVPSGVLQPDTPYYWGARVWDSDTNPQNYHESDQSFAFFTGTKGDPEISAGGIISLPWNGDLMNFGWARCATLAPWDMEAFTATGPDSTVLDLVRRYYGFSIPEYNANFLFLDPPTKSIPDGTYTAEVKDKTGNSATGSIEYAYNPVPDFAADLRTPSENAYFDTNRPSFTWGRVTGDPGDGSYRYGVRILSYEGFRWYDSPYSSDISFTLPENLNLPTGNTYKWEVRVYGPAISTGTAGNNLRVSDSRTFTINAVAYVNKNDQTCGGNSPCFSSIQTAINETCAVADIRITEGNYTEQFELTSRKALTLQGGWNSSYRAQTSNTTFIKAPKVSQGSLTMQMLTIKPAEATAHVFHQYKLP